MDPLELVTCKFAFTTRFKSLLLPFILKEYVPTDASVVV